MEQGREMQEGLMGRKLEKYWGGSKWGLQGEQSGVGRDLRDYHVQLPVQNLLKHFGQIAIQPI